MENKTPEVEKLLLALSPPKDQAREAITLEHLKTLRLLHPRVFYALENSLRCSYGPDRREYPDPKKYGFMRKRWLQLRVLIRLHRLLLYDLSESSNQKLEFRLSFNLSEFEIKEYQMLITKVQDDDLVFAIVFNELLKEVLNEVVNKVQYANCPE